MKRTCPRCCGHEIYADPFRRFEPLWLLLLRRPYWCERCLRRFILPLYAPLVDEILRLLGWMLYLTRRLFRRLQSASQFVRRLLSWRSQPRRRAHRRR